MNGCKVKSDGCLRISISVVIRNGGLSDRGRDGICHPVFSHMSVDSEPSCILELHLKGVRRSETLRVGETCD